MTWCRRMDGSVLDLKSPLQNYLIYFIQSVCVLWKNYQIFFQKLQSRLYFERNCWLLYKYISSLTRVQLKLLYSQEILHHFKYGDTNPVSEYFYKMQNISKPSEGICRKVLKYFLRNEIISAELWPPSAASGWSGEISPAGAVPASLQGPGEAAPGGAGQDRGDHPPRPRHQAGHRHRGQGGPDLTLIYISRLRWTAINSEKMC